MLINFFPFKTLNFSNVQIFPVLKMDIYGYLWVFILINSSLCTVVQWVLTPTRNSILNVTDVNVTHRLLYNIWSGHGFAKVG